MYRKVGKLYVYADHNQLWARWYGKGFGCTLDRSPLRFSERIGETKFTRLPFGWRFKWLTSYL